MIMASSMITRQSHWVQRQIISLSWLGGEAMESSPRHFGHPSRVRIDMFPISYPTIVTDPVQM
jgi:hypothetical protein